MPSSCPRCGSKADSPEKFYSVIVEPVKGERGLVQREVGLYKCERCGSTFPRVVSRRRYLFVPDSEYVRLQKEVESLKKGKASLEGDVEAARDAQEKLEGALRKARRDEVISRLESRLGPLEKHVSYLRKEKEELQSVRP